MLRPRLSFWGWTFLVLVLGGVYSLYARIAYGLGGVTHLSQLVPWGLSMGLTVLCGLGLAVGGFTVAATVRVFRLERYRAVGRLSVLIAFLSYLLALAAVIFDAGQPSRILPLMIRWKPESVLFGAVWCLLLYAAVLALEFVPAISRRLGRPVASPWTDVIAIPLLTCTVIVSVLHQSSLSSMLLLSPGRLSPLWQTSLLPAFFFVSAVCASLALIIFASWHIGRALGNKLPPLLLGRLGHLLAVLLSLYLLLRFFDLAQRGTLRLLLETRSETGLLGLEISLLLLPTLHLLRPGGGANPVRLYSGSVMVLAGYMANRLNVAITGLEGGAGAWYMPRWTEVMFNYGLIAAGCAIFAVAVRRLPFFAEDQHRLGI